MYKNEYTNEPMYSIAEAAQILKKSSEKLQYLIRNGQLGFTLTEYGLVISSKHISSYLLHEKPRTSAPYRPQVKRPNPRKRYPKARSKR